MLESVEKINEQLDYERMFGINKYNLFDECALLPNDISIVSDLAAEENKKISDLVDEINYDKELLKNTRAMIELDYRKGTLVVKDVTGRAVKLTENLIKALVESDSKVKEGNKAIYEKQKKENEACLVLDKLQGSLKSLQSKKDALSNIKDQVQLGITSIDVDGQREKLNKINQERSKNN